MPFNRKAYMKEYGRLNRKRIALLPTSRWYHWTQLAKKRGHKVLITRKFWESLVIDGTCHYCGLKLEPSSGSQLDRIDNNEGYTKSNVVPCCMGCNWVKGDQLTYKEACYLLPLLREFREKNK